MSDLDVLRFNFPTPIDFGVVPERKSLVSWLREA